NGFSCRQKRFSAAPTRRDSTLVDRNWHSDSVRPNVCPLGVCRTTISLIIRNSGMSCCSSIRLYRPVIDRYRVHVPLHTQRTIFRTFQYHHRNVQSRDFEPPDGRTVLWRDCDPRLGGRRGISQENSFQITLVGGDDCVGRRHVDKKSDTEDRKSVV